MKNNIIRKFVGLMLAAVMAINVSVPAFAAREVRVYNYNYSGINFAIEYILGQSTVTEKITVHKDGSTPIVVQKVVSFDGTIRVYQDGILTNTFHGGSYKEYVAAAQERYFINTHPQVASVTATYGCGYSQEHIYVDRTSYTVDVAFSNAVQSVAAAILAGLLEPSDGTVLSIVTAFAQYALDTHSDYIDVTETKYFVHGAYANDMNCYHAYLASYNITSSGGKDYTDTEWFYRQELV